MVKIELRQVDATTGRTATVCSEGPRAHYQEPEGVAKSWLFSVRKGTVVGQWLDGLVSAGYTRYQLVDKVCKCLPYLHI